MSDDNYLSSVDSLNNQQRRIFDDFVERISDPKDDTPFYLYIGGEAGTGKSFLLKTMIEAVNKLPKYSGQELNKPYSLTIAPTGVAAYIVNGSTIESALGIQPQRRKAYKGNTASKNSDLRFLYSDLIVIFLDEVSMVGTDKLTTINLRMQDIMGNNQFMGGVSIVCTGDFGQLPPVKEKMIWSKSYLDGRVDLSPEYWNEYFKIYYLTEKMRSKDDEFSIISDKVRKGICDSNVLKYMKNHVRKCPNKYNSEKYTLGRLSIIVRTNAERDRINSDMLEKLLPNERTYINLAEDDTNNPNAPKLSKNIPHTQTGQLEGKLTLKVGAPIMITSNHEQPRYKNNGIVNGSRGYVDSIQVSKDDPGTVEIVWVKFYDENTGALLRQDNKILLRTHTPNHQNAVPIRCQRKRFTYQNVNYNRIQFPLTLCYAMTANKSQGQTLDEVIVNFSNENKIPAGAFYTAMSRVRHGQHFYLEDFKSEYINANNDVEKQMASMKLCVPYSFKKVHLNDAIFEKKDQELKLGYINIDTLYYGRSDEFLNHDRNLLNLDILAVADTRLTQECSNDDLKNRLSNWKIVSRNDADDGEKHMGLLILQSKTSLHQNLLSKTVFTKRYAYAKETKDKDEVFAQTATLTCTHFDVTFIYQ